MLRYKEASSLIIVSLTPNLETVHHTNVSASKPSSDGSRDFQILLVKRSHISHHMANFFVFPGGGLESGDFSSLWWAVFSKCGFSRSHLHDSFQNVAHVPKPPIVKSPAILQHHLLDDPIPSEVALRIACIRETFEETGILLLTNGQMGTLFLDDVDVRLWQNKIHDDPKQFVDLCLSLKACPNVWSLYEWSNWMTPVSFSPRRFDTIFYVCFLRSPPDVVLDQKEMTDMKWFKAEELMNKESLTKMLLGPPQVYEMSRLFSISSFRELQQFAQQRQSEGCSRWIPRIVPAADGMLFILPGDDLYDSDTKIEMSSSLTIEDSRISSKNLNRVEVAYPFIVARCNVSPWFGHSQTSTCSKSRL